MSPISRAAIPADVTVVRVLLVLTGFTSALNGLLEQNPSYATSTHVFGWVLVAFGVACWWLVLRLRRARRGTMTEVTVLLALLVAIRIYQIVRFGTATPAVGLILPVLAYWRMRRPSVRDWLSGKEIAVRRVAALGAVGITVAALVVVTGAGAAVAAWPCSFPTPVTGGLQQDQTSTAGTAEPTGHVTATDGVQLAYYAYLPANPVASLVFYHGSGANSAAGYLPLGQALAAKYHVATFLVDIRGHGASGGPRGDAPTPDQVWQDTKTTVDYVHGRFPNLPVFVGGHSAGAGVVLNSMSLVDDEVAGYAFLAPDFGLHSNTEQTADASNFATVCQRPFIVNALSNGVLDGHTTAVGFAYTTDEVAAAHLVSQYTVNMSLAQNANDSSTILRGMTKPLGTWIGDQDEVFNPAKVIAYARQSPTVDAQTIPGDNHLGILANAAGYLGPWLDAHA